MPRKPNHTRVCKHCNKPISINNYARHVETCKMKDKPLTKFSLANLRVYLNKKIVAKHPKCPICTHKKNALITKGILDGVPYNELIAKYSGVKGNPEFTPALISQHKKHLHLDKIAVLEVAQNQQHNHPAQHNVEAIVPVGKRGNVKLVSAIAVAVMNKTQQIRSLELTQLAKLEVAQQIRERIQYRKDILDAFKLWADTILSQPTTEELPPIPRVIEEHLEEFLDNRLEETFLRYMDSVSSLQLKLLGYYKEVPHQANLNTRLILTMVQNMQLSALRALSDTVAADDLRQEVLIAVGKIFKTTNEELTSMMSAETQTENPVDAVYQDLQSTMVQNMWEGGEDEQSGDVAK